MRTSSLAAGIVYLMYTSEKCVSSKEFVRAFQRKNNIDRFIERTKWNKFYADRKFCVDKICVFIKFLAPTTRNRKHFFALYTYVVVLFLSFLFRNCVLCLRVICTHTHRFVRQFISNLSDCPHTFTQIDSDDTYFSGIHRATTTNFHVLYCLYFNRYILSNTKTQQIQ